MIIIAGTIELDPTRRDTALTTAKPYIDGALTQDGCEAYTWSADLSSPGRVEVFERWTSEADLAAHFAGPHYHAMLKALGAFGLKSSEVSKYRVDHREPVYDSDGKPRADFFTEIP
ncbi:MAG: antibiotic biosynthesis monooxygenase [Deltaproteobacteria bacterium]|nr:antibiotic biosynthesis monooxygenase [Deltaproteobacteria bacterium]